MSTGLVLVLLLPHPLPHQSTNQLQRDFVIVYNKSDTWKCRILQYTVYDFRSPPISRETEEDMRTCSPEASPAN